MQIKDKHFRVAETSESFQDYMLAVQLRRDKYPQERVGQRYFNELLEYRPQLAEQVRGTKNDPFYVPADRNPEQQLRFERFFSFILERWDD